jgi:TatD DNase family protein
VRIFDTHTHYDDKVYGNADELIKEMLETEKPGRCRVAGFIAVGCTVERAKLAVAIAEKYPSVFAAVGIHPLDVNENLQENYTECLREFAGNKKVAAIGEIGLDYHYDGYEKNKMKQLLVFEEQLQLAEELNLPVILHIRDAMDDALPIIRKYCGTQKIKSVMHCYSENAKTAAELVEMGLYLSFTGSITFKKAENAVESASVVPLERLMLETDCPYMAPVPFRGKVCDSSMLLYIAEKIALIKGVPVSTAAEICNDNAKKFFSINF